MGTLNEPSQIVEQYAGSTQRSVIQIPAGAQDTLSLKYDMYVQISVGDFNGEPVLSVTPLDQKVSVRANDFKLTSNAYIPLPRRLVRALGISGVVEWISCTNEHLVGQLTQYNDRHVLYHVIQHSTDEAVPTRASGDERPTTSFALLRRLATASKDSSPETPFYIQQPPGETAFHCPIPDEFGIRPGTEYSFALFYDGRSFVMVFLDTDTNPLVQRNFSALPESERRQLGAAVPRFLDHEKDTVSVTAHDSGVHESEVTIPKQVAHSLWLDKGAEVNWLRVNGALVAEVTLTGDREPMEAHISSDQPEDV